MSALWPALPACFIMIRARASKSQTSNLNQGWAVAIAFAACITLHWVTDSAGSLCSYIQKGTENFAKRGRREKGGSLCTLVPVAQPATESRKLLANHLSAVEGSCASGRAAVRQYAAVHSASTSPYASLQELHLGRTSVQVQYSGVNSPQNHAAT